MHKKRRLQNIDPSPGANSFIHVSNDMIGNVCAYLDSRSRVCFSSIARRFSPIAISSLLKSDDFVLYSTLQNYKQEQYRNMIQKLMITTTDCDGTDLANSSLFKPESLRSLRFHICRQCRNRESFHGVYEKMHVYLQQEHLFLENLSIFDLWNNKTTTLHDESYHFPSGIKHLSLRAPIFQFAFSDLSNLTQLNLQTHVQLNTRFFRFLDKLPLSLRVLSLKLEYVKNDDWISKTDKIASLTNVLSLTVNARRVKNMIDKTLFTTFVDFLQHFSNVQNITFQHFTMTHEMQLLLPRTVSRVCLNFCKVSDFSFLTQITSLRMFVSSIYDMEFPPNLTSLDLVNCDSYRIPAMHTFGSCLVSLRLDSKFNFELLPNVLPQVLETLVFTDDCTEGDFNQPLKPDSLPPRLKTLVFGCYFNQSLEPNILPTSLKSLHFGFHFEQPLADGILGSNLSILTLPVFTYPTIVPLSLKQLSTCYFPRKTYRRSKIPKQCHIYNYTCFDDGSCYPCDTMKTINVQFKYLTHAFDFGSLY